jgi:Zn-dependent M28 family amino/carboxypeptidase
MPQAFKNWKIVVQNTTERGSTAMEKFVKSNTIPAVTPSAAMMETIFAGEKITAADVMARKFDALKEDSFALSADKKISINVANDLKTVYTQNVLGVVEGSDAKLKSEYVAFGAHYDHIGISPNPNAPDKINNGADDDGSGTVSILAMARAFATAVPRQKRSALFVWHAGEEKGLWGAKYFSEFPTVPLNQIVAQLNIDMIGRSRSATDTNPANKILVPRGEIYVIGSKKMSSELGALSERVNDNFLKLKLNYAYDDLSDPNRFFYRSDHFHYARKGIPIIFYFDGVYEDYHQPGDEVEKIDFEQMQMVARTIFMTGWELANAQTRPKVDKPLTPEESIDPF